MQDYGNDLAFISNPITISYFTGYSMDPHERIFALIVFKDAEPFVFCPALNVEEAKDSEWDGDVNGYIDSEDQWGFFAETVSKRAIDKPKWEFASQLGN